MHSSKVYLKLNERLGLSDHSTVLNVMLRWGRRRVPVCYAQASTLFKFARTLGLPAPGKRNDPGGLLPLRLSTFSRPSPSPCSKIATNLKVFASCEEVVEQTLTLFQAG